MKNGKNSLKLAVTMVSLAAALLWLTGCDDTSRSDGGGGGGINTGTNAPASVAGKTINETITSGAAPFPSSGTMVLVAGGNSGDTSGNFTITGSGGATNSTGTYTYSMTDTNTALLTLTDSASGQVVDQSLVFQTTRSGTFSAAAAGGTETGTFTTSP